MKTNKCVKEINKGLIEKGIIGGYPLGQNYDSLKNHVLIAVTELRTKEEIDALVAEMGALNA
ncbi:putative glycine dehydrogenase (decarboxylating) subunit 1 [compost metagenome]